MGQSPALGGEKNVQESLLPGVVAVVKVTRKWHPKPLST